MKYIVLLCDGMADLPSVQLGGKTPMELADKPNIDRLARNGEVGTAKTVQDSMKPGSDVANLSVLGYDPEVYYSGRSPLEAASIGIDMKDTDVSLRCNLVTLSDDEPYEQKTMLDYSAGDIDSKESHELIAFIDKELGNDRLKFYSGVNYRHCLICTDKPVKLGTLTPPHDISDQQITNYLNANQDGEELIDLMRRSYPLLSRHPVNKARVSRGLKPANSIWLWGEGVKKPLTPFKEKYGISGAMISAVDLLKGIGKLAEMRVIEVEGATAWLDTNFEGKADAAIDTLLNKGDDLVYIHIEAPDECGHRGEAENKVKSIELIDSLVLSRLLDAFEGKEDFRMLICPDHPTPLTTKSHTNDPVPFVIYDSRTKQAGVDTFTEKTAEATGLYLPKGFELMNRLLGKYSRLT
ncbi:MAG: cofactor-independent phosphoglycerate mutase [Oscillospiraceae bacterium]|jgi:2,3-bisphosphoglycerate-independent phosphoglycerate mutase|nr:cofactor-independent phosphoglycerate mutase [Oscillospiraceae bacterium]